MLLPSPRAACFALALTALCACDSPSSAPDLEPDVVSDVPDLPERPAAPTELTATPGASEVILQWRDNSDDEAAFIVYRQVLAPAGSAPGAGPEAPLVELATVAADVTTYTDTAVIPGTRYGYGVAATHDEGTSEPALAEALVPADPEAPVAVEGAVSTEEDTPAEVTLTGEAVDGGELTFAVVTPPAHGTLSGEAPDLTYTPDADFHGADGFTFTVSDGVETSAEATVAITVEAVNDTPVADAQAVTTDEDVAAAVTLTGQDVDGDALTFAVVTPPAHGTLSGEAPDLTYTPDADFHGADGFTFTVSDGVETSAEATVAITVEAVNDTPVADAQAVTTDEDAAAEVTLTGDDIDGDELTFAVVTPPAHGTLSGEAPDLTYTPDADYHGPDGFTFTVSDGAETSAEATVSITVEAVNDAPVADAQAVTTDEDVAAEVTLTGQDVDGDELTFAVVTPPAHGTLSGEAPDLTYTPDADYHGADSFTFTVTDGAETSAEATVAITVEAVNDTPVADAQAVTTDEDVAVQVTLTGQDVDGDELTFAVVTPPAHGTLSGEAPDLTYTPDADFHGADSFAFTVSDGVETSTEASVAITVEPVNDAPVADAQAVTTDEDVAAAVTLTGQDVDGDALTFIVVTLPAHGTLSGEAPDLTYTPDADFHGPDGFTFTVSDGVETSAEATVAITVEAVNDTPVADAQAVTTDEDVAAAVTLTGQDVDGDALTFAVVTPPAHGTLSGEAPNVTYTPDADFHGADSFAFTVSDGVETSAEAAVSIAVDAVNDAPVADAQAVTTDEDVAAQVTLTGQDVDGEELTFTVVTPPAHGTLSGEAPDLTYTPDADFHGADGFTFTVSDGVETSAEATVSVTVEPVNDAPIADAQAVTTDEDVAAQVTLAGQDVDGDELTFAVVTPPSYGTLSGEAPDLTYTPDADYHGADSFTFTVSDGVETSAEAAVSLTVEAVNDAPAADAQAVTTDEDAATEVTLTGQDVDGDALTFAVVTPPAHGTLSGEAPDLTYTPNADHHGADSFTFTVSDGAETSAEAIVSVTVEPVNDAPVADAQAMTTDEDVAAGITLTGQDVDGDELTFAVVTPPSYGTLSGEAPDLTYTPDADYHGADSFTFTVSDGAATSAEATVSLTVEALNDAPVAHDDTATTDEDTPVPVAVLANDGDVDAGDGVHVAALEGQAVAPDDTVALGSGARVTLQADGALLYDPNGQFEALKPGETAQDAFAYTVEDGSGAPHTATVVVTVEGAADLAGFEAPAEVPLSVPFEVTWTFAGALPAGASCSIDVDADGTADYRSDLGQLDCHAGAAEVAYPADHGLGPKTLTFSFTASQATGTASASTTAIAPVSGVAQDLPDPSTVYAGWESTYRFTFTPTLPGTYTCFLDVVDDGAVTYRELSAVDCATGTFEAGHTLPDMDVRTLTPYVLFGDVHDFVDGDDTTHGFQLIPLGAAVTVEANAPFDLYDWRVQGRPWYSVYYRFHSYKPVSCRLDIFNSDGTTMHSEEILADDPSQTCTEINSYEVNEYLVGLYDVRVTLTSGSYTETWEDVLNKESILITLEEATALNTWVVERTLSVSGYDGYYIDRMEAAVVWAHSQMDHYSMTLTKSGTTIDLYDEPRCDIDDGGGSYQIVRFSDDAAIGPYDPDYCSWKKNNEAIPGQQGLLTERRPSTPLSLFENTPVNGDYKLGFMNPYNEGAGTMWAYQVEIWPKETPPAHLTFRPRGHMDLGQDRRMWGWAVEVDNFDGFTIEDLDVNVIMNWTSAFKYTLYRYGYDSAITRPHIGAAPTDLDSGLLDILLRHRAPDGSEVVLKLYSKSAICNDVFDNGIGDPYTWTNWFGVENTDADRKNGTWYSLGFRDHDDAEHPYMSPGEEVQCPFSPSFSPASGNPSLYYGGPHETLRIENLDTGSDFGNGHLKDFDVFNGRPVNGTWELIVHAHVVEADPASWPWPWNTYLGDEAVGDLWGWDLNMRVTPPGCWWTWDSYEQDIVLYCP